MDFSYVKPITDKDLDKYLIKPVGGRACYYWIHYCLIHNYTRKFGRWPLIVGVIGDSVEHMVKWIYLWPHNLDLMPYLKLFVDDKTMLTDIESHLTNQTESVEHMMQAKPLNMLTNTELSKITTEAFQRFSNSSYIAASLRFVDLGIQDYFNSRLPMDAPKADIIRLAGIPHVQSFSTREELELLEVADMINSKSISESESKKRICHIKDLYCWYVCGYYNEKAKTVEDYEKIVKDMVKNDPHGRIVEITERIGAEIAEREKMMGLLTLEQKQVADITSLSTHLKDYYKFISNKIIYLLEPLFVEMAVRTHESVEFIKSLDDVEISEFLKGNEPDRAHLKERMRHNTMIAFEDHFDMRVGKEADKFEKKFLTLETGSKVFKGRIASKGHVKGIARVVRSSNDFHKVQKGDILVVINTTPDYVPILKRVIGIVSEEGGITAHVSVISREFNLPAVVGIPRISEIIKDGEMIEVDANTGTVKKI